MISVKISQVLAQKSLAVYSGTKKQMLGKENEMEQPNKDRLERVLRELPPDKIRQVADLAEYLHQQYAVDMPQRGSPEAILQTMEDVGPLNFESGELDVLLSEIQSMREMEIETDD